MPLIVSNLDKREKTFIYILYQTERHYISITGLGIVISFLVLFGGMPNYTAFATPIIGFLSAYLDVTLFLYLLRRNPDAYFQGFEWHTILYPYNKSFPFSAYRKDIKLFSSEGLRSFLVRIKLSLLYEAYRWLMLIFLIIPNVIISKKAEAVIFNWGLSTFFWGVSYLLLWRKIYIWKSAKILHIPEAGVGEIKAFLKKGRPKGEKPLHNC
jgi:hypothetical protein